MKPNKQLETEENEQEETEKKHPANRKQLKVGETGSRRTRQTTQVAQTEESEIFGEPEFNTRRGSIWEPEDFRVEEGSRDQGTLRLRSPESWRGDMDWPRGSAIPLRSMSPLVGKRASPERENTIFEIKEDKTLDRVQGNEIQMETGIFESKWRTEHESRSQGLKNKFNRNPEIYFENQTGPRVERSKLSRIETWLGELEPVKEKIERRKRVKSNLTGQSSSKDNEDLEGDSSGSKKTKRSSDKKHNLFKTSQESDSNLRETPRFEHSLARKQKSVRQKLQDHEKPPNVSVAEKIFLPLKILNPMKISKKQTKLIKIFDPSDFFPNPPKDPIKLLQPFLISREIIKNMIQTDRSSQDQGNLAGSRTRRTDTNLVSGDLEKCRKLAKRLRRAWNLNQQISQNVFKKICILAKNENPNVTQSKRKIFFDNENRNFSNRSSNKGSVKKTAPTPETQGDTESEKRVLRMSTRRKKRLARERIKMEKRDNVEESEGRTELVEFLDFSFKNINKFLQVKEQPFTQN